MKTAKKHSTANIQRPTPKAGKQKPALSKDAVREIKYAMDCLDQALQTPAKAVFLLGAAKTATNEAFEWVVARALINKALQPERACRRCGCTQGHACVTFEGTCGWAEEDLCTACLTPAEKIRWRAGDNKPSRGRK